MSDEAYAALLGYPRTARPSARAAALARASREWFVREARPKAFAETWEISHTTPAGVELATGVRFASAVLAARLDEIGARLLVVAAVTAGSEVDLASGEHWRHDRPDEAYFLDRFGAAAAIHLGAWAGERLRRAAASSGLGLGPGYSPGYDGWDLSDQVALASLLPTAGQNLRVLDSGMIEPKSSLLAVFGAGDDLNAADRQWRRHRCSWCSLDGCGLRGRTSLSSPSGP